MKTLRSIGIFGGSFDPVHSAHVLVARAALEELSIDRLFIVPVARSPFKPERQPAPAEARLRLLRLAFAGCNDCEIDPQEVERDGVSYSIDTIRHYAGRFPGAKLLYLIGADHVPTLPEWREADDLAKRSTAWCPPPSPSRYKTTIPTLNRLWLALGVDIL